MSYARHAAMAGAVFLGSVLNVGAQESSQDGAPPSKTATQSESGSTNPRYLVPRPGRDGGEQKRAASGASGESTRHDPISPDARVIQFSFVTQPWENVLEWIAELAGMSLQMEVKPTGTFNYVNDPKKYTLGEAMDILNVQLVAKGHILLRKGNYLKVIAFKDGPIPPDLIRRIKPEELDTSGESEFVTMILPLKNVAAKTAADEVKAFASEVGGKIVAQESVNQLMITDLVANIRLMRDYLVQVEEKGIGFQARYRVFPLKYASAAKVEANLRELFGLPSRQAGDPSRTRSGSDRNEDPRERFRRMMEGGGGFQNPFMQMFQGQQPGSEARGERGGDQRGGDRSGDRGSSQQAASNITMSVDEPHNQILVMAPPDKLAIVEEFIKQVDVPREGDTEWTPRKPQVPTVRVIRLSDGDAQSLATALTQIYQNTPGVRFSADQANNAVVVVATPDDQDAIKVLAEQFEEDERNSVVLPLTVLDATSVAELLGSVYSSGQTDWRGRPTVRAGQPRVVADRNRNQLMVRGSKKQVDDIREMLGSLGEPVMQYTGTEKLRQIRLNGANSQAIRDLVEQMWPQISPNNNPIRIIELGKKADDGRPGSLESGAPGATELDRRGDGRKPPLDGNGEIRQPSRETPSTAPRGSNRTSIQQKSVIRFVSYSDPDETRAEKDKDAQDRPSDQENKKVEAPQDGPPVVVSFGPDNLVVASDDPAALQRFMDLINSVIRNNGTGGSEYTVFYLKSADATQLTQTLSDLMGISVASSLFGSSSQSGPLLRIVPDTRTNSLIVFGSANDVNRVENLIKVLDRDDAPSSGAMSAPRILPVRHASASAVARVIRDVYASRITGGSGFPGGGPSGMPFGNSQFGQFGGSSRNSRSPTGTGTMSVGVDEQSNSIVVSCSESLFQEVERLVKTLDSAASETQRTVQIVTVKNSTPTAVQDALNGLMGVTTRTTTGRSGTDSSGRSTSGGFPQFGGNTGGMPFGFQGGNPFGGSMFFNRGGDDRGFDRGRDRDRDRGGDRGGLPFGNFGRGGR
jgi:type II secretory pathway component GspD/PulD (secretin)